MIVNFNCPSSSFFAGPIENWTWLYNLQERWLNAYDLKVDARSVHKFRWSKCGVKHFAEWLRQASFKVEYWEIDYTDDNNEPIAYGIKFEDNCPMVCMEILKHEN